MDIEGYWNWAASPDACGYSQRVPPATRLAVADVLCSALGGNGCATRIEGAAHEHASGWGQAYAEVVHRVLHAVRQRPEVAAEMSPDALVQASSDVLARGTDAEQARLRRCAERDAVLRLIEAHVEEMRTEVSAGSSIVVCGKCKSDNVQWEQKQTRGADEPMTLFCKCMSCGKQWRM